MEPIRISIDINLGENTLEVMRAIAAALNAQSDGSLAAAAKEHCCSGKDDGDMPDFGETPAQAPAPAPAPAEPIKAISDDEIAKATRAAVTRLKAAGQSPLIIRTEIFAKYGINQSSECPAARREAFLADIEALGK